METLGWQYLREWSQARQALGRPPTKQRQRRKRVSCLPNLGGENRARLWDERLQGPTATKENGERKRLLNERAERETGSLLR